MLQKEKTIMKKLITPAAIVVFLLTVSLSGCRDDGPVSPGDEYIVFGSYYGECFGEACVEIFKLEDGVLYEDSLDRYPSMNIMPYEGKFYRTKGDHIADIRALLDSIPQAVLESPSALIGEPDAHDQGGLLLQVRVNGQLKYWLIDPDTLEAPVYMRTLVKQLDDLDYKIRHSK